MDGAQLVRIVLATALLGAGSGAFACGEGKHGGKGTGQPAAFREMLEASQRLDRVCAHLEGDDPSCAEGRRQWREMLGMAAPITDEPCRTDDASR